LCRSKRIDRPSVVAQATRTEDAYEAIVIGAGQSGGPLSTALARAGYRTALIEREHVGGTCINVGCTPTKTMIASARLAYLARRAADYGIRTGPISVDLARVRQRKRDIVASWRDGSQARIDTTDGVDLLFGEARFSGPKSIDVSMNDGGSRKLTTSRYLFINTGDRPSAPPVAGLDQVPALDSTSIMELDSVPEHLLVLGGGYVGLEFGQMLRRFGSRVTIVQRGKQLLAREDADVAEAVAEILREDGVQILLQTHAVRVEGSDDAIALTVRMGDGTAHTLHGSHLLVAAGRRPNTDALKLSAAGIETDERGYIRVNSRLETNVPGIYALGDVKGGPAFTHVSYDDWRIVRTNLLEDGSASINGRLVPYTVFIDPQLGRVGLTEAEARAQGRSIRVASLPMSHVARALEVSESRGFMKAIIDAETGLILGYACLGIEGGELMNMVEIAMLGKVPYTVLKEAIFAHPTLGESLNNLFMALDAAA
jgi:pyruvate/2-oxoglutarate dehydrogenase complex dihydrolipoamide dehydrogenase (E3) component